MIISGGSKILVSHRRLYPEDAPRIFVGIVDGYESGIVRVTGYTWLREPMNGIFFKKSDLRTKIFSIVSGTLIAYQLPESVDISKLRFEIQDNRTWLVGNNDFKMDLSESEYPKPVLRRHAEVR